MLVSCVLLTFSSIIEGSQGIYGLSFGWSPDECRAVLPKKGLKKVGDSTIVRTYTSRGDGPLPQIEAAVRRLGLHSPYGYQMWQNTKNTVILHFASSSPETTKSDRQASKQKDTMMLIWIEVKTRATVKDATQGESKRPR